MTSSLERLLDTLTDEGWTCRRVDTHTVHAARWNGAFELDATAADVDAYLAALGDSGRQVYGPDVPPGEANFRLLLVHLDEQVVTHRPGTTFRFVDGSIEAGPPAEA